MGSKTGRIIYNVNERGREYIGADRSLDLRKLAAIINGPEVQERVKNRDLLGYFGHSIRARFGMAPPETVVVDGKQVSIEPAIVTTYLAARDDGTIEHETEFLDTTPGAVAERMFSSKTGGFSSAILAPKMINGAFVPSGFFGFDYVREPNYTTNRGYVFDSVEGVSVDGLLFDSALSDFNDIGRHMRFILDSANADLQTALQTIAAMQEEREALYSMIEKRGAIFDSVDAADFIAPSMLPRDTAVSERRRAIDFRNATLAGYERQPEEGEAPDEDPTVRAVKQHYRM
ncbi:hypothetical protein [Burkholderia gladioli]|uniref:hypothetical protein n=1 Tax=Burkholderia gladioli TaxID=28095 RepID=UPI001641D6E2|nr:hypothetical protein [Burkholderia gladioli]